MMVNSGLEFFILKFYQPLQSYLLTCQAIAPLADFSVFLGRFFLLGSSNSKGASRIPKQKILDHFSPSFLTQKCWLFTHGLLAIQIRIQAVCRTTTMKHLHLFCPRNIEKKAVKQYNINLTKKMYNIQYISNPILCTVLYNLFGNLNKNAWDAQ